MDGGRILEPINFALLRQPAPVAAPAQFFQTEIQTFNPRLIDEAIFLYADSVA